MEEITFKKPLLRQRLYVSTKPYFLKRSRGEGEKDLERLVDTSKSEDCWLFDSNNSLWYNLAYATEEIPHEKEGINGLRTKILPLDLTNFEKTSHYHFHPKTKEEELKQITNHTNDQRTREVMANYATFDLAIPSSQDISQYLTILKENPTSSVDFRIASPRGIIIINFDKPVKAEPSEDKYSDIRTNENLVDIANKSRNQNETISNGITYLNEAMKGIFSVSFQYRK